MESDRGRVTIGANDDFLAELDAPMRRTGATNRSEALRDLARRGRRAAAASEHLTDDCIGVLCYACDRELRDPDRRISAARHARHDQTVATVSVPLDRSIAIEVAIMAGAPAELSAHAESLFVQRGVMHGSLALAKSSSSNASPPA